MRVGIALQLPGMRLIWRRYSGHLDRFGQTVRMKKPTRLASVVAFALTAAFSYQAVSEMRQLFRTLLLAQETLDQYRWTNRPVLLFAPSERDEAYLLQMKILDADKSGLAERDILVLSDISALGKGKLRETLQIDGFEIILIGKDGGVKFRSKTPISVEELFSLIDAMPMRRQEMRDM
ncbi:DUF4174 domain-containing protein [Methyloceanibacter sp.]|jgi:hypothetical protein|uniref:DUF4174 domain-containing protein n=1 Tax=Methyloceanibacter sp. TaxID=1965321 RepID=UPI003C707618